jgi:hypothetical protein
VAEEIIEQAVKAMTEVNNRLGRSHVWKESRCEVRRVGKLIVMEDRLIYDDVSTELLRTPGYKSLTVTRICKKVMISMGDIWKMLIANLLEASSNSEGFQASSVTDYSKSRGSQWVEFTSHALTGHTRGSESKRCKFPRFPTTVSPESWPGIQAIVNATQLLDSRNNDTTTVWSDESQMCRLFLHFLHRDSDVKKQVPGAFHSRKVAYHQLWSAQQGALESSMKRLIALTVRLFTAHVTKGPKGMSGRRARFSRGRVTRFLRNKAPKLVENTKKLLAMRGLACSQEMTSLLRDLVRQPLDFVCVPTSRTVTVVWRRLLPTDCAKEA